MDFKITYFLLSLLFFCFACKTESTANNNTNTKEETSTAILIDTTKIVKETVALTNEAQYFQLDSIQIGCDEHVTQHAGKLRYLFENTLLQIEFYNDHPFILRIDNQPYYIPEAERLEDSIYNAVTSCIEKYKTVENLEHIFIDYKAPIVELFYLNKNELILKKDGYLLFFKSTSPPKQKPPKCTTNYSDGGYTAEEVCHYFKHGRSLSSMYKQIVKNSGDENGMPETFPNYGEKRNGETALGIEFKEIRAKDKFFSLKIILFFQGGETSFLLEETNTYFIITSIYSAD